MRIILIISLLFSSVALAEDTAEIRHPTARQALGRAEQETNKAEQVYRQALIRIHKELVRELEQAKREAMQSHLLEEANAIQAAIDQARFKLDRLTGRLQTFTIEAGKGEHDTVQVQRGDRVRILATGRWDAATNRRGRFAMNVFGQFGDQWYGPIARIGTQEVRIPGEIEFIAEESGMLRIHLYGGGVDNDAGRVQVKIRVQSPVSDDDG